MLSENKLIHQTTQMGFVFVLKMFQDNCNRDYFQCNRNLLHLCCNRPKSDSEPHRLKLLRTMCKQLSIAWLRHWGFSRLRVLVCVSQQLRWSKLFQNLPPRHEDWPLPRFCTTSASRFCVPSGRADSSWYIRGWNLLYLTTKHVFENFGGGIARFPPTGCGPAQRLCCTLRRILA